MDPPQKQLLSLGSGWKTVCRIQVSPRQISLEPQAQLIWQYLSLDDERDAFFTVGFSTPEGFTGRNR